MSVLQLATFVLVPGFIFAGLLMIRVAVRRRERARRAVRNRDFNEKLETVRRLRVEMQRAAEGRSQPQSQPGFRLYPAQSTTLAERSRGVSSEQRESLKAARSRLYH